MSDEHYTVDGTLIQAWASQKSFHPKDSSGGDDGTNFHGQKRTNQTHQSTTDPDPRVYKKSYGKESKLSYLGDALVENRNGLILRELEKPEFILTLLIAATGLSISEALGLHWADVEYHRNRIVVRRSWVEEVGNCKNLYRKAPVAMHPVLGGFLNQWHEQTPYTAANDWVFASTKLKGTKPRCGSIASQTYLYPAAVNAGIFDSVEERNESGKVIRTRYFDFSGNPIKRWGWHNLRHSLASWLVSSGVDVKTVSSMLRHSNVRTTLNIYTRAIDSNKLPAQGQFLESLQLGGSVQ